MLELSILGFLHEGPLHGYELKERIRGLSGHVRPVSDGSLYPAINRLVGAGLVAEYSEPGAGAAPRRMLSLMDKGRARLRERLRSPKPVEISDTQRFTVVLAFLRHLEDPAAQAAVLKRRLALLEEPTSFFYEDGVPVRMEDAGDPFRQGMLRVARAAGREERAWLREVIGQLEEGG
ncbi:PadR family transcriptional regulator [Streptomyces smaragdinus]|uniref:PadR family transcriptional regulator n=1 Tax=Streptomyces smaragdinus TaxID=2585196 RepID=UPI002B217AFC|nr:PadR family transcriptional regulator [Streptomyces smaragdinus]